MQALNRENTPNRDRTARPNTFQVRCIECGEPAGEMRIYEDRSLGRAIPVVKIAEKPRLLCAKCRKEGKTKQ